MVVVSTRKSRITFNIFGYLRKNLPNADPCTLRHISAYIARCYDEFDIDKDLQLTFSNNSLLCEILLSNGSEITFCNFSNNQLNFKVEKNDGDIWMTLFVSTQDHNSLSTAFAHGIVYYGDWKYVIGSEVDNENCFIKVYYKNELMEDATSYFFATTENDISLDCLDGLGYLTTIMMRIELLYSNIQTLETSKLVRKKEN